jgi:hypothetical protein
MNLAFAVEKLYEGGWRPGNGDELERLPDGRVYPSVLAVQREFTRSGLELSIKHNLIFKCYRAAWESAGDEPGGAVVGACEREAAVYALAQLRATRAEGAAVGV